MPIIENYYDNKYISLYKEYNFRAFAQMAKYKSITDPSHEYDIITSIKIIDKETKSIIYSRSNVNMAYNEKDLVSISDYIDKIILYLHIEKETNMYWKTIFLDEFFMKFNTLKLKLYYNKTMRQIKEEQERQRVNEYRQNINDLKENIRTEYNKKGIAVFYHLFDIYFINDLKAITMQEDNYNMIKQFEKYPDTYKRFISKHIKLNWNETDIPILNELMEIA